MAPMNPLTVHLRIYSYVNEKLVELCPDCYHLGGKYGEWCVCVWRDLDKMYQEKYDKLKEAVRNLYYAAHWSPDRPVDDAKLWEAVRDAAGFDKGNAPKPNLIVDKWKEIAKRSTEDKCPKCNEPYTRPNARCICEGPMWIVIQPGQHIHIQCPIHGDVKIYGSGPIFTDDCINHGPSPRTIWTSTKTDDMIRWESNL